MTCDPFQRLPRVKVRCTSIYLKVRFSAASPYHGACLLRPVNLREAHALVLSQCMRPIPRLGLLFAASVSLVLSALAKVESAYPPGFLLPPTARSPGGTMSTRIFP